MSERYNVAASAVLGENYKITSVECSDYNPAIDGTITVTISVNDVYGDAVSGESVTVTVSEGNFTQLNGSDITSASSVTGTTNSSGQFTLTYTCSEWGLITFSANNKQLQIRVTGVKTITVSSTLTLEVNGCSRIVYATYSKNNITTTNTQETTVETGLIPSQYRPINDAHAVFNHTGSIIYYKHNGDINIRTNSSGTSNVALATATWIY